MNIIEWATTWHNLGIATIPVRYKDKRPTVAWDKYKTELPTREDLHTWFGRGRSNYGVITGWRELVVLDFDDTQEWTNWRIWAGANKIMIADDAFQVLSSRGVHVYLRQPNAGRNKKVGKIDIKTSGYVLGPGSIHPSGAEYRAMREEIHLPLIMTLSDILPAALLSSHTELPENVILPPRRQVAATNPWDVVNDPPAASGTLIKAIKDKFRVEDFFVDKVRTSSNARWYLTRCPLHEDKEPSFWLDTEHQLCGCFAGCTPKPLDVINLYARLHGLSNALAIAELAARL